jgi:hypothetical protein
MRMYERYKKWVLRQGLRILHEIKTKVDILEKHSMLLSYWCYNVR